MIIIRKVGDDMKKIFELVSDNLNDELKYEVKLIYSGDFAYLYFYDDEEIIYLLNLTLLHRATLILDVDDLVIICKMVLLSKGLI
jgi:hypothetical protein